MVFIKKVNNVSLLKKKQKGGQKEGIGWYDGEYYI